MTKHCECFINTNEEIKLKQRFVSLAKYYNEWHTFHIVYVFLYYAYSIYLRTLKCLIDA